MKNGKSWNRNGEITSRTLNWGKNHVKRGEHKKCWIMFLVFFRWKMFFVVKHFILMPRLRHVRQESTGGSLFLCLCSFMQTAWWRPDSFYFDYYLNAVKVFFEELFQRSEIIEYSSKLQLFWTFHFYTKGGKLLLWILCVENVVNS